VIQLAKDDPSLVKEVIARLRESGEIEAFLRHAGRVVQTALFYSLYFGGNRAAIVEHLKSV